jgi:hypothetical protein
MTRIIQYGWLSGIVILTLLGQPRIMFGQVEVASPSAVCAEKVELDLTDCEAVTKPQRDDVERGFLGLELPALLDSVHLDVAELVFTVSTVYDTTEPLLLTVAPATTASAATLHASAEAWTTEAAGYDPEYLMFTPMCSTEDEVEVRIEVTHLLHRWLTDEAPNYGLVLKSVSEDKSTFHWIRDGRYNGGDAKLVVLYTRL